MTTSRNARPILRRFSGLAACGVVLSTVVVALGGVSAGASPAAGHRAAPHVVQHTLVSDQPGHARRTDASLVNAWGLAHGPDTPLWVSDNGTDVSTLYSETGGPNTISKVPLTVSIPGGEPTGQFLNPTKGFTVPVMVRSPFGPLLPATDFHHGRIDVLNREFVRLNVPRLFRDRTLPRGYSPFGVAAIAGRVFVTYAEQDAAAHDDVKGAELGTLRNRSGKPIVIDGLWGLLRGDPAAAGVNAVWFSAGPKDESHGLLGTLTGG